MLPHHLPSQIRSRRNVMISTPHPIRLNFNLDFQSATSPPPLFNLSRCPLALVNLQKLHGRHWGVITFLKLLMHFLQTWWRGSWSGSWTSWTKRTDYLNPATSTLLTLFTTNTRTISAWRWVTFKKGNTIRVK